MTLELAAPVLTDLLFEEPGIGRCLVAPGGSVLRANAEWLRSGGFTLEQVLGADIVDLFPDTRDVVLAIHARVRAGHRVEVPRHGHNVNGRETWWEGSIAPVPMQEGTGLLITVREVGGARAARDQELLERPFELDAVELAALRDSEREARARALETEAILASIADGVLVYDSAGVIVRYNAAAREMLNLPPDVSALSVEERIALHSHIWSEDGRLLAPQELPAVRAVRGEPVRGEVVRVQSGTCAPRWMRISASPLRGGAQTGAVLSMTDVTDRKVAEEALRDSEEKLRLAKDAARMGAWDWNLATGEIVWSDRCSELVGRPGDSVVSYEVFRSALHPDDVERVERAIQDALATGNDYDAVMRVALPDGAVRWLESKGRALYDEQRRPVRMSGMVLDVTERKQAEDALRQVTQRERALASIIENANVPFCMAAPDGRILLFNRAYEELTGYSREEIEDRALSWATDLTPPEWREKEAEALAGAVARHESVRFEKEYERKDGSRVRIELVAQPVFAEDGSIAHYWSFITDITERQVAMEALTASEEQLRDADRRKTEFLGVLSHELRNPLAPIRTSIYVLERAVPGSEQATRAREVIRRQTDHLTRLVDDLLDITRITRGKVELKKQRLDLRDAVRGSAEDLRAMYEQSGIELRIEHSAGPVWVYADHTRVAQVIGNLLQNSLKFTPKGGEVSVRLAAIQGRAQLVVRDNGFGIESDQVERMFEPFAQAETGLARTNGGLGLGLALVRGLVEMHDGSVRAHSDGPGLGSEFVIDLPLCTSGDAPSTE